MTELQTRPSLLSRAVRGLTEISWPLLRAGLFQLDAESAHHVTMRGLKLAGACGFLRLLPGTMEAAPVELWGLKFPNRVGLAAGLDKTGEAIDGFGALGFGHVEIGTLTPRPQPGNEKPRLFRIVEREGIVNRMGFNNPGITAGMANVSRRTWKGIVGVNIGKNFDTPNERAVDDYLICLRAAWPHADYVTVNLSSPNTKGLRDLQQEETCRALIRALHAEQAALVQAHGRHVPVLIKIAPDLEEAHIDGLARVFAEEKLEGVIATNTTLSRRYVEDLRYADERGGLSGAPLTQRATEVIARFCRALDGAMPVIGVGGIMSGADALEKLRAGAALVQIYSGLIYRGPGLVRECVTSIGQGLETNA
jgi:dihydroorotate dehydrogenase